MEVTEEVCDSEGVCEVLCDVLCHHPESGESMEMHVSEKEANGMTNHASGTEQSSEPPRPEYFNRLVKTHTQLLWKFVFFVSFSSWLYRFLVALV